MSTHPTVRTFLLNRERENLPKISQERTIGTGPTGAEMAGRPYQNVSKVVTSRETNRMLRQLFLRELRLRELKMPEFP